MRGRALAASACIAALASVAHGRSVSPPPAYRALNDLRTLISAEAAYQSANHGWYDKLECLHRPEQCIVGYTEPVFLTADLLQPVKNRYHREFHPGAAVAPPLLAGASPSSLESYAYVAFPENELKPQKGFCGDYTGAVCFTPLGGRPTVSRGSCVVDPRPAPSDFEIFVQRWFKDVPASEPCYTLR